MSKSKLLKGFCALVTGAGRRLGAYMARRLAEEGADVIIHYHSAELEAAATLKACLKNGVKACLLKADLSDRKQARELVHRAQALLGQPNILVNSASIFPTDTLASLDWESLTANLNLNAYAPLLLCLEFARELEDGVIINILDTRITQFDRQHASYHLSKLVLAHLSRELALELAPRVRVNAVAPGLILPPPGKGQDYLEALAAELPLKRSGSPEDVAQAALFLITSRFITGQFIFVDGGQRLKGDVYGW